MADTEKLARGLIDNDEKAGYVRPESADIVTICTPACAICVDVDLVENAGRDPIQRAILGLLRCSNRPHTVRILAEELCIPEKEALVRNVLQFLLDDGLVLEEAGVYRAQPVHEDEGPSERFEAWLIWDDLSCRFLPLLLIDVKREEMLKLSKRAADSPMYTVPRQLSPERQISRGNLWATVRDAKFSMLKYSETGKVFERLSDPIIRRLSLSRVRDDFNLLVQAEIRPRITGKPTIFFFGPTLESGISPYEYNPEMGAIISRCAPEILDAVSVDAEKIKNDYLLKRNAGVLAKFGSTEQLRFDATRELERELRGTVLTNDFAAEDLKGTAADAETSFLLSASGIESDASVRDRYHQVVLHIARILGDRMAAVLSAPVFKESIARMVQEQESKTKEQKRREAEELISCRCRDLGISFEPWNLATHMKSMSDLRSDIGNSSSRHQLGSSFLLWLLPLVLDIQSTEGRAHLKWVRSALNSCPDLLRIFNSMNELRIHDKKRLSPGEHVRSLKVHRASVYMVWRAIGGDPNEQN